MNTSRPDIAKAAGMITGAFVLFFVIKIIVLLTCLAALLILFLKSI